MQRNVPVALARPEVVVTNSDQWLALARLAAANPEFTAVEIKAFYVIGLIDDICQSVSWLLTAPNAWPDCYLPAFGVFASAVDLLGRCLTGNTTTEVQANLLVGLKYLPNPWGDPPAKTLSRVDASKTVVVRTNHNQYTISDLEALRHYSAHGQSTTRRGLPAFDIELLDPFPVLMGAAIEAYWRGLQENGELCERLAVAELLPYSNRELPLRHTLEYFAQPGNSAGSLEAVSQPT